MWITRQHTIVILTLCEILSAIRKEWIYRYLEKLKLSSCLTFNVTIYHHFKLQIMSWELNFGKVISLQILDFCCKMRLLRRLTPSLTPAIDVLIKQSQSVIIWGQIGNYMQSISDNTLIKFDKSVKLTCCCLHKQEFTFNGSPQLTITFAHGSLTRIKSTCLHL